jgi:predicted dehydrogenase
MSKVKFAVIGCGHIGKRHAEMIERNEESELVALVDIKPKDQVGIDAYSASFFNSVDALLQSPELNKIDVINIASPNGYHVEHALKCLEAKKHVVIEKPMALNKQDAELVIYKALNVHKHVFAVMQNRYSPPSVWIKDLIESGRLGNIYMVQLNCYWNRDSRYYKADSWHGKKDLDGGTLFTQFSHFIDLMYWLFGDIKNIHSRFSNFNHKDLTEFREDSGMIQFDFVNGGSGCMNFSTSIWDKNLESSMTIIAEHGSVKIGGLSMRLG